MQLDNILEDLGCYLSSQGTEEVYRMAKIVEADVFEDIELKVIMNISEIFSCFWLFKENKTDCKPTLDPGKK